MLFGISDTKAQAETKETKAEPENDDFTLLKSLAEGQKSKETNETPVSESHGKEQLITDELDSTKNRRLADDYDSTKARMDYGKYQHGQTGYHAPRTQLLSVVDPSDELTPGWAFWDCV